MLIRHKITLWFIGLSGLLLCLFSVYIYFASENSRRELFYERLKNKALATKEIYDQHNIVAERIITSIPEQSEYVFDENNKLIFAINDLRDFDFNVAFFETMSDKKEKFFEYQGGAKVGHKEGYAFVFGEGVSKRLIVITAYNKTSFEQLQSLRSILLYGNLFFLLAVGLTALFLSKSAFRPINDLVKQAESVQGNDMSFRLHYANPTDEIGIVASSFNKVLDKMQSLADSQKSFISYASHELRTPLAAINGILETSSLYDKDLSAALKSQQAALKEIQKATELVNTLLQLANIESIKKKERQRLNIVDVMLDAISFFKLKKPEQEFLFEVSEIFSKETIELDGNSQLLRTAFINLIDNASKYSNKQKIRISVSLTSNSIQVQVTDSGIGLMKEDLNYILNPLFRGKNTKGIEGFGLGLSLTQRIIALHEGELHFLPNVLNGTIVEVLLPISSIITT